MSNKMKTIAFALILWIPSAQASMVDFTSSDWSGVQGETSFELGDIRLTSTNLSNSRSFMTFNDPDGSPGCGMGNRSETNLAAATGLACVGDGIGIVDDEITQRSGETLIVSFLGSPVNVTDIHFLDLFARERTGEIAVINGIQSQATNSGISITNNGGYWETGLGFLGVSSLIFTGMNDNFSDFSIARIQYEEITSVPEPSMISLLGAGFIGLGIAYRRRLRDKSRA